MKTKMKKITAITLVIALVFSMAVFCGGCKKKEKRDPKVITYWSILDGNTSQTATTLAETAFAKKLMEEVGCEIQFIHPAAGQGVEKFTLMLASGNLPDIIEANWDVLYPGGREKALSDGLIQPINLETDAPNLKAYLDANPNIDRLVTTEDGEYIGFPFIRGDAYLQTYSGPIVRQDWLDELGMSAPETIDDWTEMLRAFKSKKKAAAPFSTQLTNLNTYGLFSGAYGTYYDLYAENGKVVYGPLEDNYKDYLKKMNEWYKEGLLDPEFATVDGSVLQGNILNGVTGATAGSAGGNLGKWLAAAPDEKFDLVGAKYPVLNKGDDIKFGQYDMAVNGTFAAISKDCNNYELCAKLLDYGYSEEGHMLFNFGIEGESYTMVDGYPTYTEDIVKNKDGLSMAASMARYCRSHNTGAFVQDKRYMEQYSQTPQQKNALNTWLQTDAKNHILPPMTLTSEQEIEMTSIEESLATYRDQMQMKFITGELPLSKYDEFRDGLRERGVDKYVKYHQEAYNKFIKK